MEPTGDKNRRESLKENKSAELQDTAEASDQVGFTDIKYREAGPG